MSASRHDSLEEILHVGTQLSLVNALVEVEEVAELLDRSLVVLAEVAANEALCLNDDGLYQLMILLRSHRLGQLVTLSNHAATFAPALGELELLPLLAGAWTLQDIDVEVSKFGIVEVEVRGTVGIVVEQIGTSPVEHRHEVIADAMDALCREVTQTLLIYLYLMVAVRTSVFDGLYDWQRLNDAPAHAITLDILAQVADFLSCPYLA